MNLFPCLTGPGWTRSAPNPTHAPEDHAVGAARPNHRRSRRTDHAGGCDAAVGDPDMTEQWATNEQHRIIAYRVLAQLLADRGAGSRTSLSTRPQTSSSRYSASSYIYCSPAAAAGPCNDGERWTAVTIAGALLRSVHRVIFAREAGWPRQVQDPYLKVKNVSWLSCRLAFPRVM